MSEEKRNFENFLKTHFIKQSCGYEPIDLSQNYLRHYGLKSEKKLFLSYLEIFYIFIEKFEINKQIDYVNNVFGKHTEKIHIYLSLKNANFNILETNSTLCIYEKSKNFNRKTCNHIGELKIMDAIDNFQIDSERMVVAVLNINSSAFLQIKHIDSLEKTNNDFLHK
ncbi:hypothetical protein EHP00_75 [Ecytonucleospora hepatopenaei]|uniref:Uncharacterized protein n=1 Tax=Ecytonucleospora hepatopenaei TaxID=646526 RepID=A0A1W0E5P6_9MICR|nr:hypothetical protein EHP00_75 [Ecytonucleospora hepatopenaei]